MQYRLSSNNLVHAEGSIEITIEGETVVVNYDVE